MRFTALVVAIYVWILLSACHGFSAPLCIHPSLAANSVGRLRRLPPLYLSDNNSYIPDGLTPDEYAQIKEKEANRLKKMDYGAFGPRSLKVSRPQGDWFLTPSLWTSGYDSNRRMSTNDNEKSRSLRRRMKKLFKQWGPAIFLSYLAIDVGIAMEASWRASKMKPRQLIFTFLKSFVWAKHHSMWLVWWKAQAVKSVSTAFLTAPMQKYMEFAEDKWGWSRRYVVLVTSGILLGGSIGWTALLMAIKHLKL